MKGIYGQENKPLVEYSYDMLLHRKLCSLCNKTLRGIALRRQGRCRLCDPPQAENSASGILLYEEIINP